MDSAYLYILRCVDGNLYVGTTRKKNEARVAEHNSGALGGYTSVTDRLPWSSPNTGKVVDAIAAERQIKGWSRAKKEGIDAGAIGDRYVYQRGGVIHFQDGPPYPSKAGASHPPQR